MAFNLSVSGGAGGGQNLKQFKNKRSMDEEPLGWEIWRYFGENSATWSNKQDDIS